MNSESIAAPADDIPLDAPAAAAPVVSQPTSIAPPPVEVVEAEKAREDAWRTRNDWTFLDKPLEAWSMERETLFVRLVEADVPGEPLEAITYYEERLEAARHKAIKEGRADEYQDLTITDLVKPMAVLPYATKLLFLAVHKPEQFDHLRGRDAVGRFLRAIGEWAAVAIPESDPWPAILLARDIRARHRHVVAQRRPYPGRSHLGN